MPDLTDTAVSSESPSDPGLASGALAELLAVGRERQFRALTLSDEEMAVLSAEEEDVTPRPWLADKTAAQREFAQAVALRGLVGRGLIQPIEVDPETAEGKLVVDDLVLSVLGARRAASDIVLAQRRSDESSWFLAMYGQGDFGVLEEHVSPGGLHEFWFVAREDQPGTLAAYADVLGTAQESPPDTAPPLREVRLSDLASGSTTIEGADARMVTVVSAVAADGQDELRYTALAYPDRVELARTPVESSLLQIRPASREDLLAISTEIVQAARLAGDEAR